MGVKPPRLHLYHNLRQLNIFECLFIVLKGVMLLSPYDIPLLPYPSFLLLKEPCVLRSLSHSLGPLGSHSPLHDFCQGTVIFDFCVTILSGR